MGHHSVCVWDTECSLPPIHRPRTVRATIATILYSGLNACNRPNYCENTAVKIVGSTCLGQVCQPFLDQLDSRTNDTNLSSSEKHMMKSIAYALLNFCRPYPVVTSECKCQQDRIWRQSIGGLLLLEHWPNVLRSQTKSSTVVYISLSHDSTFYHVVILNFEYLNWRNIENSLNFFVLTNNHSLPFGVK